jgi:hypothetical protein
MFGLLTALIPPQFRILAGGIALAVAAVALALFLNRIHHAGVERGRAEIQAKWDADRARQLEAAVKAEAENRAKEEGMAASVAAVATHYSKENVRAKAESADLRRRLADGSVRLTVPGACSGGDSTAAPAGPAGGSDGRTAGELPASLAATLSAIGAEADEVARQLGACQAILRSERNQ